MDNNLFFYSFEEKGEGMEKGGAEGRSGGKGWKRGDERREGVEKGGGEGRALYRSSNRTGPIFCPIQFSDSKENNIGSWRKYLVIYN